MHKEIWDLEDFKIRSGSKLNDYYICLNSFGKKGYHLATRSFTGGIEVEWNTVKQLTNQEVIYALQAGITGWFCKPKVRVKAKMDFCDETKRNSVTKCV